VQTENNNTVLSQYRIPLTSYDPEIS